MKSITALSFFYFIFAAFPFAHAQNTTPAYEIFQREVYPFLQERCAECHGKNQFDAPQHSPPNDPQTSYKQILSYVHLSEDWELSSRLISFGGTRHCREFLGTDSCGADRAELLSVVRNWISKEIKMRPEAQIKSSNVLRAKDMLARKFQTSNHNLEQGQNKKSFKIIQISTATDGHTCALFENKKAKCWGTNGIGQLGVGFTTKYLGGTQEQMSSLPYVLIDEPILQIAAGPYYTCAVLESKRAKCWGSNNFGQLGIGADVNFTGLTSQEMRSLPYVLINEPILQIAAGNAYTCALLENKRVKCWGANSYGQLGVGSNKDFLGKNPEEMRSLPDVMLGELALQISVGSNHSCAVLESKKAKCWGYNKFGKLGSEPKNIQDFPYVSIKEPILQISAGGNHTCALVEDQLKNKKVTCWGNNEYGQLGLGINFPFLTKIPQKTEDISYVQINESPLQISAGDNHNCVLIEDQFKSKKAKCWGTNEFGQLSIGVDTRIIGQTPEQMQQLPYVVISDNILQISAASTYTCFLLESGKMKCFGNNDAAQLGSGDFSPRGIIDIDGKDDLPDVLVTAQEDK